MGPIESLLGIHQPKAPPPPTTPPAPNPIQQPQGSPQAQQQGAPSFLARAAAVPPPSSQATKTLLGT